jgi:hypothetical protein
VKNERVHGHKRGCEGKPKAYQIKLPRRNLLLIHGLDSRLAQARRQVHKSRSINLDVSLRVDNTGALQCRSAEQLNLYYHSLRVLEHAIRSRL